MDLNSIKIFCIYPEDNTTNFLNKIVVYLEENLGEETFYCFRVRRNQASHNHCLEIVNDLHGKFIMFLGHGRSDMLYGACGHEILFSVSNEAEEDNEFFFKLENFITSLNSHVFKDNIIFSFSCNSNENKKSIGESSIQHGAITFVGFGNIQTDYVDKFSSSDTKPTLNAIRSALATKINKGCSLNEYNEEFTKNELAFFKGIIVKIIKKSILYAYEKDFNVEQLVGIIKILTSKEICDLLKMNKGHRYKLRIAKNLYHFKDDIAILGDSYAQLF